MSACNFRVKFNLFALTVILCATGALFCACDEAEFGPCFVGYLGTDAPQVATNLEECEYGICVSTEVPRTKENPEGGFSAGYCSRACESDGDCPSGWKCLEVISQQSLGEIGDRGYTSVFAGNLYCTNPAPALPTDADIQASQVKYAEEKYPMFVDECLKECIDDCTSAEANGSASQCKEICDGRESERKSNPSVISSICPHNLAGFCSQSILSDAKQEYTDMCCYDTSFINGHGGTKCCSTESLSNAEDPCCDSPTFIDACKMDESCKSKYNQTCSTPIN